MNTNNFATLALVVLTSLFAACGQSEPRFESFSVDNSQCTTSSTADSQINGIFRGKNDEEVTTYKFIPSDKGIEPKKQVPIFDGDYAGCFETLWKSVTLDAKSLPKEGQNFGELLDDAGLVLSDRSSPIEDICIYASDGEDEIELGCSNFDPIPLSDVQRRVQIPVDIVVPRGNALRFSIRANLRPRMTDGIEINIVSIDVAGTDGRDVAYIIEKAIHMLSLTVGYY